MTPTDVFNCEYFDDLKRKWQANQIDKDRVRIALLLLPQGDRILPWLDRPFKEGLRNVLTMEKFNE